MEEERVNGEEIKRTQRAIDDALKSAAGLGAGEENDKGANYCSQWSYPGPAGWPEPLRKALSDEYVYALGLRSGRVVLFTGALWHHKEPDWICLNSDGVDVRTLRNSSPQGALIGTGWAAPRGTYVRIDDIEWCEDAPYKD